MAKRKMNFSYYCREVRDDVGVMDLIESYQGGRLIRAQGAEIKKPWWSQFIEVTDEKELARLIKLHDDFKKLPQS